ncbi:hypothetical protein KQX54_017960 [Cotesia glomerata]|uniref:Uncharacterized protein n=1 Tax=Cotesia glomerata TaxID=32391 RepID=A0AAV7IGP4_COTGL|nr:hypothetical protein KQX54_017960 [Cotesia glomerata]
MRMGMEIEIRERLRVEAWKGMGIWLPGAVTEKDNLAGECDESSSCPELWWEDFFARELNHKFNFTGEKSEIGHVIISVESAWMVSHATTPGLVWLYSPHHACTNSCVSSSNKKLK